MMYANMANCGLRCSSVIKYTLSGFSSVVFIHMRNTTNNSSIQRGKKPWDNKYSLRRNYS